jgi:2-dehydropantoate 2-reductase
MLLGAYGEDYAPQGKTAAMHQIAADFQQAGIAINLTDNLLLARWKKLVWNVPFNGLSVVLNATTEDIMADPPARSLAADLMQEVATGAKGCHIDIPTEFIGKMLDDTAAMRPYLTSMKLDYDSHRPLEVEAICGQPLRAARAAGVALPKMEMLYQQLKSLDARNRA